MMTTIRSHCRLLRHSLHRWCTDPRVHMVLRIGLTLLSGFFLSAASLANYPQPFVLGLVCPLGGMSAALAALGGALGYWVFWGQQGLQGALWALLGLGVSLLVGSGRTGTRHALLLPSMAGLICALSGLAFQRLGDSPPLTVYLLRIALAMGSARLFTVLQQSRDSVAHWLAGCVAVLALAQVFPFPWLCLGYLAAAAITVWGAYPAAGLAGLALDLSGVSSVSMTAVLSAAWLVRFLPLRQRWVRALSPALLYPCIMALSGSWDLLPLPGLLLGGLVGLLLPSGGTYTPRRGEVGVAQVRLELTASVLSQMQQLLLELSLPPIDEAALVQKAHERACGSCSARKNCPGRVHAQNLSTQILNFPILDSSLPFSCRRSGRLLQELRRSQEQLRQLRAGQARQQECRAAVIQQYRFLSEYLQTLSDDLSRRTDHTEARFTPEVSITANRAMADNGDHCLSFAGTGCRYFVLLCDGMGTGIGAVDEARTAGRLLKQLLQAGFPAQYALSSLNSLCALRDRAGAVTVDLAEIQLDTGRTLVYKWGAAVSWLLSEGGCEKIGTAGPPPGVSVADEPETALRLSLRRGEILALVSDGVGGEDALRCHMAASQEPLSELAARILACGVASGCDDATVALIRLRPTDLSA